MTTDHSHAAHRAAAEEDENPNPESDRQRADREYAEAGARLAAATTQLDKVSMTLAERYEAFRQAELATDELVRAKRAAAADRKRKRTLLRSLMSNAERRQMDADEREAAANAPQAVASEEDGQ